MTQTTAKIIITTALDHMAASAGVAVADIFAEMTANPTGNVARRFQALVLEGIAVAQELSA